MQYNLQYAYSGSQAIIMSDRVHIHSKSDSVLILGKQAVGISSTNRIGIQSSVDIVLESEKIQLGENADQNIILGRRFFTDLSIFLKRMKKFTDSLTQVSEDPSATASIVRTSAGFLSNDINKLRNSLSNSLSKKSYVK